MDNSQEEVKISLFDREPTNELKKENIKKVNNEKNTCRKILRKLKKIFIILGILLLLYTIFNIICSIYEDYKVKSYSYGTNVNVNGHNMVAKIEGEANEHTIIFLTGFIVPSPVIYYKPFTEFLSKQYKVVTIEPFGYGLSDIVDDKRTIDNVATEIHTCIEKLNIKNYYLMAHSLGGIYTIYYSIKYPNEVLGFIGLDNSVPRIEDYGNDSGVLGYGAKLYYTENLLGYNRIKSIINKNNLIVPLPESSYNYTDEDKEMFRNIQLSKGFNKSIRNEGTIVPNNYSVIHDKKFPSNMTVIQFISSSFCESLPIYKQLHIDAGSESLSNEVIVLSGKHGDFFIQHMDEIMNKMNSLIKK